MFSSGLGLDSAPIWGMHYSGQAEEEPTQEVEVSRQTVKGAKQCIFLVEGETREIGSCTFYGACRHQGQDYMYQVILVRT